MPIAARYHELRNRVVATVDDKLAEPVRLSFMKNGQTDPDRLQRQIDAMLRTGEEKPVGSDGGSDKTWRTKIAAGQAELRVDRAKYPDVDFEKGDAIRAMSRPGEPLFEVLSVNRRDHSRLIVRLGQK
ncbi:hypothetical protein [Rhizobium leguminosarum]|uniref:hypothetical protein n=1 Tax=Rhizobium leguminosarum TaxID=384 RepID=UPI001FDA0606|nr:hypothetical protein [Rhizobium leguminosarum]